MTTLYAYQGKDFEENATFLNSNGSVFDVTNCNSYIKVAKYYENSNANNTVTINGTIISANNGIIRYTLPKDSLLTIKPGKNVYTRYLVANTGVVLSVNSGEFMMVPSVL